MGHEFLNSCGELGNSNSTLWLEQIICFPVSFLTLIYCVFRIGHLHSISVLWTQLRTRIILPPANGCCKALVKWSGRLGTLIRNCFTKGEGKPEPQKWKKSTPESDFVFRQTGVVFVRSFINSQFMTSYWDPSVCSRWITVHHLPWWWSHSYPYPPC